MFTKIISFKNTDGHYILTIFKKIQISIKHKCSFDYKPAVSYGLNQIKRNPELIVSITSYPGRIHAVHKSINTLLRQSLKPDKIVLWLAKEQFPDGKAKLPEELLRLEELGLEIRWCEDLKSYKKLIPALREFPDAIIVTADDDIYYEKDWLECLYREYLKNKKNIYVKRAIKLDLCDNTIIPLSSRKCRQIDMSKPSFLYQMLGGSGCLYPPGSLYSDTVNGNKALEILPYNDDIFFWIMSVLNKTKIVVVQGFDRSLYFVDEVQQDGLCHKNREIGEQNMYNYVTGLYPELLEIIKAAE